MSYPKTASILAALLAFSFGGTVLAKNTDSKQRREDVGAPGLIGANPHSVNANRHALSGAGRVDADDVLAGSSQKGPPGHVLLNDLLPSPGKNVGQGKANAHGPPNSNQSNSGQASAGQPMSSAAGSVAGTPLGSAFAHSGEQIQVPLNPGLIDLLGKTDNGIYLPTPLALPVAHIANEPSIVGGVEPGTLRSGPAATRTANIQSVPDRGN